MQRLNVPPPFNLTAVPCRNRAPFGGVDGVDLPSSKVASQPRIDCIIRYVLTNPCNICNLTHLRRYTLHKSDHVARDNLPYKIVGLLHCSKLKSPK